MTPFIRTLFALSCLLSVAASQAAALPRPDHVVVVIEENRSFGHIMDTSHHDSYLHALTKRGMLMTQSYGVAHPSQPNYLALFSGSTQGVTNNGCPYSFDSDNLATALLDKRLSFASYSESLPAAGDTVCTFGSYMRKHNPVVNWQGTRLPAEMNLRFSDMPLDYAKLPTVAFVIPNQAHDMHDGSFDAADDWLKTHIEPYVQWAFKHNSLLILTWDEDDYLHGNHIFTLLVGPMVKTGSSDQHINHYDVLRTLLDSYDLPPLGASSEAEPIKDIWKQH